MGYIGPNDQLALTTASDLSGAAGDLREHARRLRLLLPAYHGLVSPVSALDNNDTWAGPFPDQFGVTRRGWERSLSTGVGDIEQYIRNLETDAAELELRASNAGKPVQA
jgi:hypothetical protein